MNKASMNIAIVGLGGVAQEHLRVWRKINNIRVAAGAVVPSTNILNSLHITVSEVPMFKIALHTLQQFSPLQNPEPFAALLVPTFWQGSGRSGLAASPLPVLFHQPPEPGVHSLRR